MGCVAPALEDESCAWAWPQQHRCLEAPLLSPAVPVPPPFLACAALCRT